MKKEIKNVTILEKTVRPEKAKILKRVQDDMVRVQRDMCGVQDDSLIKNDGGGKTVRRENGKILKRVQDDMRRVQHDMELVQDDIGWLRCLFGALAPDKVLSPFTSHFSQRSAFTSHFSRKSAFTLAEGATHVVRQHNKRRAAFTLAEVLITLGIIGIVAAMTMPTLIQNYKNKTAVTRLKHFSSMMQQIGTMRYKDIIEGKEQLESLKAFDGNDQEKYFNTYLKPYAKWTKTKKTDKAFIAALPDGSGIYLIKIVDTPRGQNLNPWGYDYGYHYLIYCVDYKTCEEMENADISQKNLGIYTDGKSTFVLGASTGRGTSGSSYTRDDMIKRIKSYKYTLHCPDLIEMDGWEIKKDNPCF